jgi:hypothetical protein
VYQGLQPTVTIFEGILTPSHVSMKQWNTTSRYTYRAKISLAKKKKVFKIKNCDYILYILFAKLPCVLTLGDVARFLQEEDLIFSSFKKFYPFA